MTPNGCDKLVEFAYPADSVQRETLASISKRLT